MATLLDLDPFVASSSLPSEVLPIDKPAKDVIHIEIRNNHILYKIGDSGFLNRPAFFWIYETYLHFNGNTWPLHELPRDPSCLNSAQGLEFTYNGRNLSLPKDLNDNILTTLNGGYHVYECHSFQYSASKNLEFEKEIEVTFDRSIIEELGIEMSPHSGSSNWVHSIPKISLDEGEHATLRLKNGLFIKFREHWDIFDIHQGALPIFLFAIYL